MLQSGWSVMRTWVLVALAAAMASLVQAQTHSESRLALVIGNASYRNSPLANPVNDARLMEVALKEAGFTVVKAEDASLREMRRVIRDFGDRLKASGGVGLFYFAGHGVQVRGENYLISTDSDIRNEDEVADDAINANLVLEKMQSAGNRMNLVILDACRNNPFVSRSRSSVSGLATMSAPSGSLVAYSTAPGSVASDGIGGNGLYTEHLARAIRQSGLPVEEVFKQVRSAVRRESNNQQTPWENTALEGQFYFKSPLQAAPSGAAPGSKPGTPDPMQVEFALWDSVKSANNAAELQTYLGRYPNGVFADVAKVRIAALQSAAAAASQKATQALIDQNKLLGAGKVDPVTLDMAFWESVKSSQRPAELEAYVAQFPKGLFAALAKVRIDDLTAKPPAAAAPPAVVSPVSATAAAASVPPTAASITNLKSGAVVGNLVVRDQMTRKMEITEILVKDKSANAISFTSGDVVATDGQVLAVSLGTVVVSAKSGALWKLPLQAGASGQARIEVKESLAGYGTVEWKVIASGPDRMAVDVDLSYPFFVAGSRTFQRYGKWLGTYAADQALPISFSISTKGNANNNLGTGPELLTAEWMVKR